MRYPHGGDNMPHPDTKEWCERLGIPYLHERVKEEVKFPSPYNCEMCFSKNNMHWINTLLVCPDCGYFIIPNKSTKRNDSVWQERTYR